MTKPTLPRTLLSSWAQLILLIGQDTYQGFLLVMLQSGEVKTWKSTVLIERCRYLEATQCKGICSSVCKVSPDDHISFPARFEPS